MNRKRAIAAMLAAIGNVVAVAVVRGQQEGRRPLPAPTQQELAAQGDLEREVTALRAQVQELSRIQAGTVGFTKVGDRWEFAPGDGSSVVIKAPAKLLLQSGAEAAVAAGTMLTLNGSANVNVKGALIKLN